jgi:hypothetical protein
VSRSSRIVGTAIDYPDLQQYWFGKLRKLGYVKARAEGVDPKRDRTGKNLHELRDIFRTRWHISGADPLCAEFHMGHTVDPLGYNKAMQNKDYTAEEYQVAEPILNIMSNPESPNEYRYKRRVTVLEKKLERKDEQNEQLTKLLSLLQDPAKLARLLSQV